MCARFVDASVFVHAFLRPKRALKPHERALKRKARDIVSRINRGEEVCTSVVHMAEIANILEDWMSLEDARSVQVGLCMRDTVTILQVSKEQLIEAVSVGQVEMVWRPEGLQNYGTGCPALCWCRVRRSYSRRHHAHARVA